MVDASASAVKYLRKFRKHILTSNCCKKYSTEWFPAGKRVWIQIGEDGPLVRLIQVCILLCFPLHTKAYRVLLLLLLLLMLLLLLLLHDILLLLLQKHIDLVLKTKAQLDGAQAEAAGFCQVAFGPVDFAKRLRSFDVARGERLQQQVNKLREMKDICSASLSDYDTSRRQLETCFSERIEELGDLVTEEENMHRCYDDFAIREASFAQLIRGMAEGYPITLDSWLQDDDEADTEA